MNVDITTKDDLIELEAKLASAQAVAASRKLTVKLSRHLQPEFFIESRVAALLATFGTAGDLTVCDWHNKWREQEVREYFQTSLVGMSAALYGSKVINLAGASLPDSRDTMSQRVAEAGGILEPRENTAFATARGTSITFCAFDPDWSEPAALAGTVNRRDVFKDIFRRYRRKYLEVGHGVRYTPATREASGTIEDFVFELYQNTYRHGRLGPDNCPIPGLRYLRLRKHMDSRERFLQRAHRFPELSNYLAAAIGEKANFKFYEIAVSDNGMGMVGRLLHTRRDLGRSANTSETQAELVNDLLSTPLSSDKGSPGAGYGLQRAMAAIKALKGFVSLRTGCVWLCRHFAEQGQAAKFTGLTPIDVPVRLATIAGTHFNILLPVQID